MGRSQALYRAKNEGRNRHGYRRRESPRPPELNPLPLERRRSKAPLGATARQPRHLRWRNQVTCQLLHRRAYRPARADRLVERESAVEMGDQPRHAMSRASIGSSGSSPALLEPGDLAERASRLDRRLEAPVDLLPRIVLAPADDEEP